MFWGERGRYRDITKKGFPSRLSKHTPLVLYTSCLQIVFKLTPLAKVFTFSRKVFFIFNIFPSFDLSTTCVVVIAWYFLRRQFWLCVVHSVPHDVVAVFIFFTHSDTISIMLLEFSPPFFFVHWSGRNVIWKAIEARSISRKKGWRKGEKIKKFGYILFSFPGMFLIKCLILFLSHLVTTVFFPLPLYSPFQNSISWK